MHAWDLGAAAATAMAELERRNSWMSRSREAMDQAEIQAIRDTMVRQESIFKEQVRELHSLCHKQRNIVAGARKSMLPPAAAAAPPTTTTTTASILGTRDFLQVDAANKPPMKRRRTFDLEKLPEENGDDDDEEYSQDQTVRPGSADVYGAESRTALEHRPRVVEMPLFPIPSRLERSELPPPENDKLPKYVGWSGNLGKLNQESYWFPEQHQKQHQQVVAPQWFSQNVGAQSQRFMPSHLASNDPWRNATASILGQHGAYFGNNRLEYQQNGKHYSSAMNYPVLVNPVMNVHDLARPGLVAHSWFQQLPAPYSYFTHLTHEKPAAAAAAAIDDKRVYSELRNSWNSGNSTPAAAVLFSHKPPLPPSFGNRLKEDISSAKLGGQQQDNVLQQNSVCCDLHAPEGRATSQPVKAAGECSLVRQSESTPGAGKVVNGTGSDSTQADKSSSRKDSVEALVVDDKKPDKEPLATTECIGETEMSISDTATILLSLAPAKKPSREASSVIEASLMSDLKLFKSVAIMLKESGAVKTTTKKLVARPSCRKQGEGGAAAAGNAAAAGVKAAEQKSLHTWMWGDVTRRKRMQRQRPQQVQV